MWLPMQIYKKESKSQLTFLNLKRQNRCDYLCKYIKKKANHNHKTGGCREGKDRLDLDGERSSWVLFKSTLKNLTFSQIWRVFIGSRSIFLEIVEGWKHAKAENQPFGGFGGFPRTGISHLPPWFRMHFFTQKPTAICIKQSHWQQKNPPDNEVRRIRPSLNNP